MQTNELRLLNVHKGDCSKLSFPYLNKQFKGARPDKRGSRDRVRMFDDGYDRILAAFRRDPAGVKEFCLSEGLSFAQWKDNKQNSAWQKRIELARRNRSREIHAAMKSRQDEMLSRKKHSQALSQHEVKKKHLQAQRRHVQASRPASTYTLPKETSFHRLSKNHNKWESIWGKEEHASKARKLQFSTLMPASTPSKSIARVPSLWGYSSHATKNSPRSTAMSTLPSLTRPHTRTLDRLRLARSMFAKVMVDKHLLNDPEFLKQLHDTDTIIASRSGNKSEFMKTKSTKSSLSTKSNHASQLFTDILRSLR